jgi:DNA-binding transcriptional ArsR family regulator
MEAGTPPPPIARYADLFAALATEPRLRILRLLLAAHPDGLVVGEIQQELGIPSSTLSHHLEKLRHEGLLRVRRESQFLRYSANAEVLRELMEFLFAECCSRRVVPATAILHASKEKKSWKAAKSGKQ